MSSRSNISALIVCATVLSAAGLGYYLYKDNAKTIDHKGFKEHKSEEKKGKEGKVEEEEEEEDAELKKTAELKETYESSLKVAK
jgi:hypothetical protein